MPADSLDDEGRVFRRALGALVNAGPVEPELAALRATSFALRVPELRARAGGVAPVSPAGQA